MKIYLYKSRILHNFFWASDIMKAVRGRFCFYGTLTLHSAYRKWPNPILARRFYRSIELGFKEQTSRILEPRLKVLISSFQKLSYLQVAIFTSMHNIGYFSNFFYCAFGRPYAQVVTPDKNVTISALKNLKKINID